MHETEADPLEQLASRKVARDMLGPAVNARRLRVLLALSDMSGATIPELCESLGTPRTTVWEDIQALRKRARRGRPTVQYISERRASARTTVLHFTLTAQGEDVVTALRAELSALEADAAMKAQKARMARLIKMRPPPKITPPTEAARRQGEARMAMLKAAREVFGPTVKVRQIEMLVAISLYEAGAFGIEVINSFPIEDWEALEVHPFSRPARTGYGMIYDTVSNMKLTPKGKEALRKIAEAFDKALED